MKRADPFHVRRCAPIRSGRKREAAEKDRGRGGTTAAALKVKLPSDCCDEKWYRKEVL